MKISVKEAVSYRTPLAVKEVLALENGEAFSICPRCRTSLDRDYQSYCDRCGQCLDWSNFDNAEIIEFEHRDKKSFL